METQGVEEALKGVHKHEDGEGNTPECWPKNESEDNGHESAISLECVLEEETHEYFSELTVRKGKSPKTKIGGSVGYGTEDEFDGLDHLVDEVLTESVRLVVAHVLELLVERLHLVFSLLDEFVTLADVFTISNSLISTAVSALNTLDTWSITISDISEFDFILSWVIFVGS